MIHLLCPGSDEAAASVVGAALHRSCGLGQVLSVCLAQWRNRLRLETPGVLVVINPLEAWSGLMIQSMRHPHAKLIVLGQLPPTLARHLGAEAGAFSVGFKETALCAPAPAYGFAESELHIEYAELGPFPHSPLGKRPFLRYDFTDEWNNLGYGAICTDDSIWAISQQVQLGDENCLARVMLDGRCVGAYAGLWGGLLDTDAGCLLWYNRAVGPVDSQEWRVVELFLAHFAWPERACQPVLSEVPYGFDAAVTMRLDCDEDVESARSLWQAYRQLDVPFSLALHAKVLADTRHHELPREVLASGGAVLSHTATHAPDWGGSYAAAFEEGRASAAVIEHVIGTRVRFAVSPFHQTPAYARAALADAGYEGCIGGIIRNDPDFLMARSGCAPGSATGFIGHSQQCMLHGDCMLDGAEPLAVFKQAFDLAKASGTFFGYLDHPFSARYQYGWATEDQRIQVHRTFVEYMKAQGNVLFVNEADALNFLLDRSAVSVQQTPSGFRLDVREHAHSNFVQALEYGGQSYNLSSEGVSV